MELCSIERIFVTTEIGILKIRCCSNGIHEINFLSEEKNLSELKNFEESKILHLSEVTDKESKVPAMACSLLWLKSFFSVPCEAAKFDLPPLCKSIFSKKGNFTKNVWRTLMKDVLIGETISYGALATLCGNAGASRAVGTAMKNNPVPVIIPCHRVVKSDGSIGHYSGGCGIKEWLLKHEQFVPKI